MSNIEKRCEHKHFRTVFTIIQSVLIFVLIAIVIFMMLKLNRLQGTARVVNYAGLVRGSTQRLIKLEIIGEPEEALIIYLDEVLNDLKYGNGSYELVCLDSADYQNKLDNLIIYWDKLKYQINLVRLTEYEPDNISELVQMSEVYFKMADDTVSAAEIYSDKIAHQIGVLEFASAIDMSLLLIMLIWQTVSAMRIRKKNLLLAQKAYIDTHTGLKNKNMCEELLNSETVICEPTACLMFDINNLKLTNDTWGHLVGDRLISDFATVLKNVVPENDFAGRCGGDEFMVILHDVENDSVNNLLSEFNSEVEHFNSLEQNIPISYAQGWAISTDYVNCTYKTLFNEADHCMYINKQAMKKQNS